MQALRIGRQSYLEVSEPGRCDVVFAHVLRVQSWLLIPCLARRQTRSIVVMSIISVLVAGFALPSYLNNVIAPSPGDGDGGDDDDTQQREPHHEFKAAISTREEASQVSKKAVERMMDSLTRVYDTAGVKVGV